MLTPGFPNTCLRNSPIPVWVLVLTTISGWSWITLSYSLAQTTSNRPISNQNTASSSDLNLVPNVEAPSSPEGQADSQLLLDRSDAIDQLLTHLALSQLPREYEDDRKWGQQTERWDGIHFEREQGRLKTHRRKKLVNNGTWKKYRAALRNPEQELQVQIRNLRELSDGKLSFEIHVSAHVDFKAQQVVWEKGLKLLSLSVVGHTKIQAQVNLEIDIQSEGKQFPPEIVIKPQATSTQMALEEFRIDRVGKLGGEIAQQLGREAQRQLTERLPEYEQKAVDKINAEFAKQETGYRFSFSDLKKSKWAQTLTQILGSGSSK